MISVGVTDLCLNHRSWLNSKSICFDNLPTYSEATKIVDKLVHMLTGEPALEIYIYINSDDDGFISDELKNEIIKKQSAVEHIEVFCRSYDTYGVLLADDIQGYDSNNKYIREIIDYMADEKGSELKVGDIVFCECDRNFHIVRSMDDGCPSLSDFTTELEQVCSYMPLRFLHKVPKYIINEMGLNILYECEKIVQDSAPTYDYDLSEIYHKYKDTHPWLRIL